MRRRTKIICTIGPAVDTEEQIERLIDAGMDVARLNFSHGTHASHAQTIERLKRVRRRKGVPLAILLDTKGPEIRLGPIQGDQLSIQAGQKLCLVKEALLGDATAVQLTPPLVIDALRVGDRVLIDNGYLISSVIEKRADRVVIQFSNPGVIKSYKGVNVPEVDIALPALTEQDVADLAFGVAQGVDLVAASFIRSAHHVQEIKLLLAQQGGSKILVLSKIENSLGVKHFEEILHASDGIMVARGDLGVEMPLQEVPRLQKMMIHSSIQAGKPVVTATQMLESMMTNPRPTRAEVSDVANAIYDSTSAVMLSGETAVGRYPIESVQMMHCIAEQAEKDFNYRNFFQTHLTLDFRDISSSVALASVKTAYNVQASAIFCFTSSGSTARHVSRFRPQMPIIATTANETLYHQMALNWGVFPTPPTPTTSVQEALEVTSAFAQKEGIVKPHDLVIVTAGAPFGISGSTNMMRVETITTSIMG